MAHKYGQEITIATMDTSIQVSFTDPPESSADIGVHDHGLEHLYYCSWDRKATRPAF